ncbi:two component regulator with propeller domain [Mucilaginibacter oryzae]|uniref:Two component regulator with propeller domain n=1 Tax=Mucilaginibacter oryzae TaxID=468058 RepID=A0A316H124_9SPHI|nr:two-component regulator propeller domain-containing protein [Mucilaginibacter oryzae]PWK72509.1 two component regulator with propeller domain [Mucilaginibacter oryzae]
MKNKKNVLFCLVILLAGLIYLPARAQQNDTAGAISMAGPKRITRNVIQDRKGNIWMAAFDGMFRYDGRSFTNVTHHISQARFFAVLEDRKGNLWFTSVGSGVYHYDGKSFRNFTTRDGLASDRVTCIYEDKAGNIWFGTEGGATRYDGKSFKNLKMTGATPVAKSDSMHISAYDHPIPENSWMHNDVNAIIEDKNGRFWFATRGYTRMYDGKTLVTVTNSEGKPLANVRSMIKDKKGNIWLGGHNGLQRYDGHTFTNFTRKFVGFVYEDRKGNIWTSSESADNPNMALSGYGVKTPAWALSRYDGNTLNDKKPTVTEIANKPMIFGILEDDKGNIWFGAMDGVYRYDGKTVKDFKKMN